MASESEKALLNILGYKPATDMLTAEDLETMLCLEELNRSFWPIVVMQDRYGGAYSKGAWLAIADADEIVAGDETRAGWCLKYGPHGEDTEALEFWVDPPSWIGAGRTPDEAIAVLREKTTGSVAPNH